MEDRISAGLPFGWIGRTAAAARATGYDVREALAAVGVTENGDLIRDETMIAADVFLLMCALLINALDDEMHGTARTRMVRGTASMAAKAIAGDRHLEAAIATISRLLELTHSPCRVRLNVRGPSAEVRISSQGEDASKPIVEELMAHFLQHQFSYFIGFPLPLTGLATIAPDHPSAGGIHPFLNCPVHRGRTTAMYFPTALLPASSSSVVGSTPLLDAQLFWLSHRFDPIAAYSGDNTPMSAAVLRLLCRGDLCFRACSAILNQIPHALRHQLLCEGTTFRRLQQIALVDRARPLLIAGNDSEDVADVLGYADARSLRRALKTATGQSLDEFRKAAVIPSASPLILRELHTQALRMA